MKRYEPALFSGVPHRQRVGMRRRDWRWFWVMVVLASVVALVVALVFMNG